MVSQKFHVYAEDEAYMSRLLCQTNLEERFATRARILLEYNAGTQVDQIAYMTSVTSKTVINCIHKYEEEGVCSLFDKDRSGRPKNSNVDAPLLNLVNTATPINKPYWTRGSLASELNVSVSTIDRSCERQNINIIEYRQESTLPPNLKGKNISIAGLYLSNDVQICVFLAESNGSIYSSSCSIATTRTPDIASHNECIHENSLNSLNHALINSKNINNGISSIFNYSYGEFLSSVLESYTDYENLELAIIAHGVNPSELNKFSSSFCLDSSKIWLRRGARRPAGMGCSENIIPFSWFLTPKKSDILEGENGTSISLSLSVKSCNKKIDINLEKRIDSPIMVSLENKNLGEYCGILGSLELALREVQGVCNKIVLSSIANLGEQAEEDTKIRYITLETMYGRVRVSIPSELSGDLGSHEYAWTATTKKLSLEKSTKSSYQSSADDLNFMFNRANEEELSAQHIHNLVERTGKEIDLCINQETEIELEKNDYYQIPSLKEGSEESEKNNEDGVQEVKEESMKKDVDTAKVAREENIKKDIEIDNTSNTKCDEQKDYYNKEFEEKFHAAYEEVSKNSYVNKTEKELRSEIETNPNNTVYINIDGVIVKLQNMTRQTKNGGIASKDRKTNEIIIVWISTNIGTYVITARNEKEAVRRVVAILSKHSLIKKEKEIVIITDGAKKIRNIIMEVLESLHVRVKHILDWYHITKRVNEKISMALKPGKENKKTKEEVKRSILTPLWYGNVEEAINAIENIDKSLIRNKKTP